jgi:hypothetical protein
LKRASSSALKVSQLFNLDISERRNVRDSNKSAKLESMGG